jgi:hypothetical protein
MKHRQHFVSIIEGLCREGRYRVFVDLERSRAQPTIRIASNSPTIRRLGSRKARLPQR